MHAREGVSIITCTNKPNCMQNIFENYAAQQWPMKELVIVLNRDDMDIDKWRTFSLPYGQVRIYQLPEEKTLGECLNYAVEQTSFDYVATFDDDDFYAPPYLHDVMEGFYRTQVDIVGKRAYFAYIVRQKALVIRFPDKENQYVDWLDGGRRVFHKRVFDKVRFRHQNTGEDVQFCLDSRAHGYQIYSVDRFNHVYIRNSLQQLHTWKVSDADFFRSECLFLTYTEDYKGFVKWLSNHRKAGFERFHGGSTKKGDFMLNGSLRKWRK